MAFTALEALQQIRPELSREVAPIPAGWLTDVDWAEQAGLARCTVNQLLLAGVRKGVVERQKFRLQTGHGVRAVWHYRRAEKP